MNKCPKADENCPDYCEHKQLHECDGVEGWCLSKEVLIKCEVMMSNEMKDWLREGGACCDCFSTYWEDGEIRCSYNKECFKVERCHLFVDTSKVEEKEQG